MTAPHLAFPPEPGGGPADDAHASPGDGAQVEAVTFGCRLNAYESEVARANAVDAGGDDLVIVNTCAVTAEAVRQARQTIRKLRRERPEARLVVTGCAAQIEPERFAAMPEVDAVVGNHEKLTTGDWALSGGARVAVGDIMEVRRTAGRAIDGLPGRARAYVQVQNGCDHRCTFCVIPYGRGNSRSTLAEEVVAQVRRLVENGVAEVVLSGVDITSWGADLPGAPKLGDLVRAILEGAPDLMRLRLSSLDAVEIDPALFRFVVEEERVAPHLHLSLQSGDDMILKRMKRRHARADAIRLCAELKAARPDIAFGADLIAGFPTETEEMFANTLDLVEACGLSFLHVFPFSPRPGTPAARMPQLEKAVVKARAARLRAKGEAALAAHLAAHVGTATRALMETPARGRLADFTAVTVAEPQRAGGEARVRVTGHDGAALLAEAVA